MAIRPDEVRHVAALARLELGDEEVARVAAELSAVLEYAAAIREPDPGPDEPAADAPGGALREDEPAAPLPRERALAMAPESEDGFFVVPAFLEGPEP